MDILLVLPHLGPGGAQRVATLLANHWHERGLAVGMLTLFAKPADAHVLHGGIQRECLADFPDDRPHIPQVLPQPIMDKLIFHRLHSGALARYGALSVLVSVHLIRRSVQLWRHAVVRFLPPKLVLSFNLAPVGRVRPLSGRLAAHQSPVVISFLGATNIQTVVAARGLATKVIISERNDPALQQLNPPWERLRPVYYPEADIVTANSAGAVRTLGQFVPKGKLRQVPNALVIPPCPAGIDPHQKRFIAVARLVDQKGIDILLDAFGLIAPDLPEWELDIVGDGPNRQELHEQAERLGVSDRVTFHGHQQSPFPFYYRASVFVLSSRFEGMPNAMLEAMGCGLAIVTTDASSGPLEFVEDSVSGLTVPVDDPKALAEAMRRLAVEDELRCRLADAGRGRVQGLDPESVSEVWDGIIRELHTDFGSALAAGRST